MNSFELWTAATPNGWKVSIMVEELKSLGFDLDHLIVRNIDLMKGEHLGEAFRAQNPNRKIPVLIDGARSIMESCAILQYLAEKYPSSLLPQGEEKWDVLPWVYWQAANVGPAFGNRQSYVRYMDDVPIEQKQHPMNRFLQEAHRLADILEDRLSDRTFVCGDELTIADIAIYPWIRGWKWSKVDMTQRENLQAWMRRIRSRPSVERGLTYGTAPGETDQWSEETKRKYAKGGAAIT